MDNKEWLVNLKVGDEVTIQERFGNRYTIFKVEKLTNTLIIVNGRKFSKENGCSVPRDTWNNMYIQEPTEKIKNGIVKYRWFALVHSKVSLIDKMEIEDLKAIYGILKKYENKKGGDEKCVNIEKL